MTTARLYECRKAVRFILGDKFAETLKPWRELIGIAMKAKKLDVMRAVIDIGQRIPESDGAQLMLLMAAGVEMIESSSAPPSEGTR